MSDNDSLFDLISEESENSLSNTDSDNKSKNEQIKEEKKQNTKKVSKAKKSSKKAKESKENKSSKDNLDIQNNSFATLDLVNQLEKSFQEEIYNKNKLSDFNKEKYYLLNNSEKDKQSVSQYILKTNLQSIPTYPLNQQHIFNGLLYIGDPHVWSKKPGRRLDSDFVQTVINKLEEAIIYANDNNLCPICLGDLFENAKENDIHLLTKLSEVLSKSNYPLLCAVGNHDIHEYRLTSQNPLLMLEKTGLLYLLKDNGFHFKILVHDKDKKEDEKYILLGSTPYGFDIPDNVLPLLDQTEIHLDNGQVLNISEKQIFVKLKSSEIKSIEEQEKNNKVVGNVPILLNRNIKYKQDFLNRVNELKKDNHIINIVWITHHDLAMSGAYPNSIPLKEIIGVDYVVNGHIHGTKTPVKVDSTIYYNPGNITRMKIDMLEHKPAVWCFNPFSNETVSSLNGLSVMKLYPHYLNIKNGKDIFKLTDKLIENNVLSEEEIKQIIEEGEEKVFVNLLSQKEKNHDYKTDDGALIYESLSNFLKENQTDEKITDLVLDLFHRATNAK